MVEESKITRMTSRKAELIAELAWSRVELSRDLHAAKNDLDVVAHFRHSVVNQKTAWLTGAAITGWILSRLPSRKKSAAKAKALPPAKAGWIKETERTGILITIIHLLFNLLKPALATFATRKLTELASRGEDNWRRPMR